MKADRDDAPDYLQRRREGLWRLINIMAIESSITWTGMALFAKPIVFNVVQLKNAIKFGDQPAPAAKSKPNYPPPEAQPSNSMPTATNVQSRVQYMNRENSASRRSPQMRQTSFNNHNYALRADVNTMQAPSRKFYASNTHNQQRQSERKDRTNQWSWENGYKKQRTSGQFEWVEINDSIDYAKKIAKSTLQLSKIHTYFCSPQSQILK
jgi:hypothetical protein